MDGGHVVERGMSVGVADGNVGSAVVVLGVDRDDVWRREAVDGGDDRGRDQAGIGKGQEVKAVVDHVEFRGPLEHLRNMEALGDLRVDARVLRPASRDHTAKTGGGFESPVANRVTS